MAFGFISEGGYGAVASVIHPDTSHPGFVDVPDADLLFRGDFGRAGPDLVLTGQDGRHHIIPGYFSSEHHAALVAPNGAKLPADLVELLAGSVAPGQYAQAQPTTPAEVAGKVEKVVGDATVIRNGVSVTLNVGDAVYKSDVIQTGDHSSVGISFPDGTALNLVANTRMALNEYSYDSNSTSNSALFSLVEGTFSFVAGKVAHTGDMKIATPVATMGIRGTTGSAHQLAPNEIATVSATLGDVTYMFTIDNDLGVDTHGIYDLILNGVVVGSIAQPGLAWFLDQNGNLISQLMSDSQLALDRALRESVYEIERIDAFPHSTPGSNGSPEAPIEQLPNQGNPNGTGNEFKPFTIDLPVTGPNGPTDVTFTVHLVEPPPTTNPAVTVTPLGADQLKTGVLGTTSHALAPHVQIDEQSTTFVPNSAVVTGPNGVPPGLVTVDAQGNVEYSNASFEFLSQGETVQYTITFDVQQDGNVVQETLSLTIVGANEPPVFAASNTAVEITEPPHPAGSTQPLVTVAALTFTDPNLDDTAYTTSVIGVTGAGHTQGLADAAVLLTFLQTDGVTKSAGSASGTADFAFSAPEGSFDYLSQGETVTLNYTVQVTDPFGATSTQTVSVTVVGTNEPPVFTASNTAVEITEPPHPAGSTQPLATVAALTFTDPNLDDTAYTTSVIGVTGAGHTQGLADAAVLLTFLQTDGVTKSAGSASGTADFAFSAPEGSFDYLSQGETVTLNYTVQVTDPFGATSTETVSVTIAGTNEAPVFSASDTSVQIAEPPHPAGSTQPLTAVAALTFTDPNLDDTAYTTSVIGVTGSGHTQGLPDPSVVQAFLQTDGVIKSAGSANGTADFAFSAPEGSFDYLSQGETVTLNYKVQVTDPFGATSTQTVSVTVVGTNEAPVILPPGVPDPGPIQAPAGTPDPNNPGHFLPLTESNNFTFTDPNYDDTHTVTVTYDAAQSNVSLAQALGTFTATLLNDSTGGGQGLVNWQFTVDPAMVNALAPGTVLREVADITVTDEFGASAVKEVVITIDGPTSPTGFVWLPDSPTPPATSGNWNIAADWSGGVVPGSRDSAAINNPVVVTVNDSESVDNLAIATGAVVDIVDPGSLAVFGTVSGGGTIELFSSSGEDPTLAINGTVTLQGGGTIDMVGVAADNKIVGVAGTNAELLNVGDTITGSGTIGQGDTNLTLVNDGTVNATGIIVVETGSNIVQNAGLLEATDGGTLTIDSGVNNTSSGTVKADGATLTITDTINTGVGNAGLIEAIHGGVVTITAPSGIPNLLGGTVEADGAGSTISITASTLSGNGSAFVNFGTVESLDGGTVTLAGHGGGVGNQGTIDADGGIINIDGVAPPLMGGGVSNSSGALIEAQNSGTVIISAAGTMSNAGTVDADGGTVSLTAGNGITNTDLLEATSGGTLEIFSNVDNVGGTIAAYGSHSSVQLSDVTIIGGELATGLPSSATGGMIEIVPASSTDTSVFDGASDGALTVDGYVRVDAGANLEMIGAVHNEGTIDVDGPLPPAPPAVANLVIDDAVTLDGGGTITLDSTTNQSDSIIGAPGGGTLDNVDNTISGSGYIGVIDAAPLTLNNEKGGTIDADLVGGQLVIDTGSNVITNAGTIEANGGTLEINGSPVTNTGELWSTGGGTFVLSGETVTNYAGEGDSTVKGTVQVDAGATLDLENGAINGGNVNVAGLLDSTGTSSINDAAIAITGTGTIEATSGTLTVDPSSIKNSGLLEAADSGTLVLSDTAIANANGTIAAGQSTEYGTYSTLNDPSAPAGDFQFTGTFAQGINDADQIVGYYVGSNGSVHGFLYSATSGFVSLDDPSASSSPLQGTFAEGINDTGQIVGSYSSHGFLYSNGSYVTLDDPLGVNGTAASGINNAGQVVGTYYDASGISHGFLYSGGNYTTLDDPLALGTKGTFVTGINNEGQIIGGYIDANGTEHSFVYSGGHYTSIDDPLGVKGTIVFGINDSGEIVGSYNDANDVGHSFVYSNGTYTALNDPSVPVGDTVAYSINNAGEVAGYYAGDGVGAPFSGFLADPLPTTVILSDGTTVTAGTLSISAFGTAEVKSGLDGSGATLDGVYASNAGTIEVDASATLALNNSTIAGGTLETIGNGVVEIVTPAAGNTNTSVFDGSADPVTIDGYVRVDAGANLELIGTIHNEGTIDVDGPVPVSPPAGANLVIDGVVTLDGGGTVTLDSTTDQSDSIIGASGGGTLDNVDNTISGAGDIGILGNTLTLDNETKGTIDATGIIVIETGTNPITNAGLLEATGGGTLEIQSDVNNVGGTIAAHGDSSMVQLANVTITGGTLVTDDLTSNGGGEIEVLAAGETNTSTFDGSASAVTVDGYVNVDAGAALELIGTIHNEGTINLDPEDEASSKLIIDGTVTLDGGGNVTMSGSDEIVGASGDGTNVLENFDKISGAGSITGTTTTTAPLKLHNEKGGIVDATGLLTINTGGNRILNAGVLEATQGGELDIDSKLRNVGLVLALSGSEVRIDANVHNKSGGTIVARGHDAAIDFSHDRLRNDGDIFAKHHGTVSFDDAKVANDKDGIIAAAGKGASVVFCYSCVDNDGLIKAASGGTVAVNDSDIDNACGIIAAYGHGSTVQLSGAAISYGDLDSAHGGKIEILSGAASTFDDLTNRADVVIDAGATLILRGTIDNDGLIVVDEPVPESSGADLVIDGRVTLKGSGAVELDGNDDKITGGGSHGGTLYNFSTIDGYGQIGTGSKTLTLDNKHGGTIDADIAHHDLIVDTGCNTITNAGLMEATGGTLVIKSDVDNKGGTIGAYGADALTKLFGVTITGGALTTGDPYGNDGVIEIVPFAGMTTFDGTQQHDPVTVAGFVDVDPGAELELKGDIDLKGGVIQLDQTVVHHQTVGSDVLIDGTVKLDGDGYIALEGNHTGIVAEGSHATLDNDSYIYGSRGGFIGTGNNALTLDNEKRGVIDSEAGDAGPLVIDTGCNTIINAGILEATGASALYLYSNVDNKGGTIAAYDAGSVTKLFGVTITGGTLTTGDPYGNDGVIEIVPFAGMTTFDGTQQNDPVTIAGFVDVDPGAELELKGDIDLKGGVIQLDQTVVHDHAVGSDLLIDGTVKLDGDGYIALEGNHTGIVAEGGHATLDNDSYIYGSRGGFIGTGNNALTLDNEKRGVINSEAGDAGPLVIDTGCNTVVNAGILEATGASSLYLYSNVDNKGGTIAAYDAGSVTKLFGVTITGGKLVTGDPYWRDEGIIEIAAAVYAGISIFDGSQSHDPVTIAGFVQVDPGAQLELKGDIDLQGGAIELDQTAFHETTAGSDVVIDGTVTLTGYGDIALEGNHTGIVGAGESDATLVNDSSIYGSRGGFIGTGDNSLTFINKGLVDSEAGDAGPLVINTGHHTVINTGTLEATGGSELDIKSDVDNACGTIGAYEDGSGPSVVKLFDVAITGGTLATDDLGSKIEIVAGDGMSVFNGPEGDHITVDGYVRVDAGANLELIGTVDNQGTIDVDCGPAAGADLIISGTVTLDGGGTVTLDGSGDEITGASHGTLDNVDDTISGAGKIGTFDDFLTLLNKSDGTIDANIDHGNLTIDTGDHTITNTGTLEAMDGGILDIKSEIDNSHGSIQVDVGSSIDLTGMVSGGSATIDGGTLEFDAKSSVAVQFDNGTGDTKTYGELVLGDPLHVSGGISGFAGTSSENSDEIDLVGISPGDVHSSVNVDSGNTVITITEGEESVGSLTLDGYTGALDIASDNHGGTLITDPPTADPTDSTAAPVTTDGAISFASAEPASVLDASFTPEGAGYLGSFSLDPVTESNGSASVEYGFTLGNDQINLAAGQTVTQSYDVTVSDGQNAVANQTVSVSVGGPGNDNFVFAPGVGADTIINFNPQADTIDLSHFATIQSTQQLASLITSDAHGDAVIDLGQHDSITLPGLSAAQLQTVLQSVVHLH